MYLHVSLSCVLGTIVHLLQSNCIAQEFPLYAILLTVSVLRTRVVILLAPDCSFCSALICAHDTGCLIQSTGERSKINQAANPRSSLTVAL